MTLIKQRQQIQNKTTEINDINKLIILQPIGRRRSQLETAKGLVLLFDFNLGRDFKSVSLCKSRGLFNKINFFNNANNFL